MNKQNKSLSKTGERPKQSIKEQLAGIRNSKSGNSEDYEPYNTFKDLWKLPLAKPVIVSCGVFAFIYLGKFFLRQGAHFIDSYKEFKRAFKE